MAVVKIIDPVTRLEGHLKVEVTVDVVDGVQQVVDAWSTGTLFRGFETILLNRDPWDAQHITQRICGVCPVSHGMAAVLALDAAAGVSPPSNARILRNLVLGANYLQSHILHFYHLALQDFVDGPDMQPWQPSWKVDKRMGEKATGVLVQNYLAALESRRKAHEAGALWGGRLPHPPAFIPGGMTTSVRAERISKFKTYMNDLISFIDNAYSHDVMTLEIAYNDYFSIGRGPGNLLSYGVFDQDAAGTTKLLRRGRAVNGSAEVLPVNPNDIEEEVSRSWYDDSTDGLQPSAGKTVPQHPKSSAYSWLKAPRYSTLPQEVGPLARMWVNGDYRNGISVMDRHLARSLEAAKVAKALRAWVDQLQVGQPVWTSNSVPLAASSVGLTEAPRGALGHWLKIANQKISHYQVVTPTCWNASPRDGAGVRGPVEEALVGTPVQDVERPIEVLRVIHSFDPCLSCAVHVMRPGEGRTLVAVGGLPAAQRA